MSLPREAPGIVVACSLILLFGCTTVLSKRYLDARTSRAGRFFQRGRQLDQQGKTAAALEEFRNALAISRDQREYLMAVALGLMRENRSSEAETYFQELLRDRPGDALSNLMLARIALQRRETDAAIDYYNRAIYGRWPADTDESRLRTRWELVATLKKANRRPELVAELLQISSDEPSNKEDRTKVAEMLLEAGAAEQASNLFHELLQEGIRGRQFYAAYGESLLETGDYNGARDALVKADPADEKVRENLALVNTVLSLDPLARNVSRNERYERSVALLKRVLALFDQCGAAKQAAGAPVQIAAARDALTARPGSRNLQELTDQRVSLAEQLWDARHDICGSVLSDDEPLRLAMRRLSR